MAYKLINIGDGEAAFDDQIEDALNEAEDAGWKVVHVETYPSGHWKVLLHQD